MTTATEERIRVAYVVHTFDMGGLERCVAHMCDLLDRARYLPMVICLGRNGAASNWIRSSDVRIVELKKRRGNDFGVALRLARVLRENCIDLVHSQNWGTLVETALARMLARVRWHVHGEQGLELSDLQLHGFRLRLRTWATRWAFSRANAIVAVADSLKERIVHRCGIPRKSVHVIPNGVEVPSVTHPAADRTRIRRQLGISDESLVVGSVGRLAPVKDFAGAINALSKLLARGNDVHLMLLGDGPERANLIEQSKAAKTIERVHFLGRQANVGTYLSAMDIYINSSISEGASLSIMEAMASGLPLVVTDAGDNATLIDGQGRCGLVVPVGDADALADALETLIQDPAERARFGTFAKERHAESFTAEHAAKLYEDLYTSLQD